MEVSGTDQQDNKKRFVEEFDDPENIMDESKPGISFWTLVWEEIRH